MRHIHRLPWPEWERFALLDVITVAGVILALWLVINRLPHAHRLPGPARRRPPPWYSPKGPPPSLLWLAWRRYPGAVFLVGGTAALGFFCTLLYAMDLLQPLLFPS
jgi:hypothetical protein